MKYRMKAEQKKRLKQQQQHLKVKPLKMMQLPEIVQLMMMDLMLEKQRLQMPTQINQLKTIRKRINQLKQRIQREMIQMQVRRKIQLNPTEIIPSRSI